jgi:phosphinothricin acetyltransferase
MLQSAHICRHENEADCCWELGGSVSALMCAVRATSHIRLAQEADADAIAAIYGPIVDATAISFEIVPPGRHEMARRLSETLRAYPWLVCDLEGQVAGYAYASRHHERSAYQWSVNASVYVDSRYQRRGVGHGLYLSLFAILAAQGFVNAYAGITLPNPGSVGLHEAMGFEKLGVYRNVGFKLGAWHDVGWWQLTLKEHVDSPREPMDLASVASQPGWSSLLSCGEPAIRA